MAPRQLGAGMRPLTVGANMRMRAQSINRPFRKLVVCGNHTTLCQTQQQLDAVVKELERRGRVYSVMPG